MKRPFRPYCNNLVSPMQLFPNVPYEIDNYHFERWCIFVILKFHNRCHHDFNDEANFVDRFYNIFISHKTIDSRYITKKTIYKPPKKLIERKLPP